MDMTRLWIVLLLAGIALSAGCKGLASLPESSLTLRNATTNALISTAGNTGGVTLDVGDELPIIVVRTVSDDNGGTDSSDVTQFADFIWDNGTGTCDIDAFGNITALQAGQTQLRVRFRPSALDPWDTVRLDITVN
jgi:hypothetical protein